MSESHATDMDKGFYSGGPLDLSLHSDPLTRARRIFFRAACSHYGISRNDSHEREEYKSYGIDRGQEEAWRKEFIGFWVAHLSVDDLTPLGRLDECQAFEALPPVMKKASLGDAWVRLRYAETIYKLVRCGELYLEHRSSLKRPELERVCEQGRAMAMELWKGLVEGDIDLAPESRTKIAHLDIVDGSRFGLVGEDGVEDYVSSRAAKRIASATNPHKVSTWD